MPDPMSNLFNSIAHSGVALGSCVIIEGDDNIVYAGPIKGAPSPSNGALLLLCEEDFARFKAHIDRRKN